MILPPGLRTEPRLARWIGLGADDTIVARTGKVEIGQGILTALRLIVAEELDVEPARVSMQTAHTGRTPNEGITAGSMSLETSGAALRQAAAWLRRLLLARAAAEWGVSPEVLAVTDGVITAPGANRPLSYWQLGDAGLDVEITESTAEKDPASYRLIGRGRQPRLDLADKARGAAVYVHDLDCDLHARLVRPPSLNHRLDRIDFAVDRPGVLIADGSCVAVAHPDEYQAVRLSSRVAASARWRLVSEHRTDGTLNDHLKAHEAGAFPIDDGVPVERPVREFGTEHRATYSRPFLMHGSLAPSAAWAFYEDGRLSVRCASQGIEILRGVLARALGMPADGIDIAHREGSGCYGHNGADDAAFDAALVARALPGRSVLLQWSRADEHRFEPYGPAMRLELGASLSQGRIVRWRHDVWSFTHAGRPSPNAAGVDLVGSRLTADPIAPSPAQPRLGPESGIHRNALPLYRFPVQEVVKRFSADSPLRTSSLRSLGAHANVFAIESFMDELAALAGTPPDEFRRRHLGHDRRALKVLDAVVDLAGGVRGARGWQRARGMAIARYKNRQCCAAVVVEVTVDDAANVRARRAWIAADAGRVVDQDGLVNQLEGGFVQALSWTLHEQVTYDADGVTSIDWDSYPVLRFSEVPAVETVLVDHPRLDPVGAGEALQGPTSAAMANAVFAATGVRVRDLPLVPGKLREAAAR